MPEPGTPTAVALDAIEHFVEARLLCQALQFRREILLERLAAPLSLPLKRSVDIGWEITNEHVCHACIMKSYWVPGQAVSRDEGEQTTMELARVRIATTQQLSSRLAPAAASTVVRSTPPSSAPPTVVRSTRTAEPCASIRRGERLAGLRLGWLVP